MKTPVVLLALGLAAIVARSFWVRFRRRRHDPIEYYRGWGGYTHPIGLDHKITKEEADVLAAEGRVYLIGYYDANGRLIRVVKMLGGAVFFDFEYAYDPNGTRKCARITNNKGVVTLREYDRKGR